MNERFNAQYKNGDTSIGLNVAVFIFVDGGVTIAYCPALDLSGYGNTEAEARLSFSEVARQYIEYCVSKGTLLKDLEKHGWNVGKHSHMNSPYTLSMLRKNKTLRDIVENKDYSKYSENITVPSMA